MGFDLVHVTNDKLGIKNQPQMEMFGERQGTVDVNGNVQTFGLEKIAEIYNNDGLFACSLDSVDGFLYTGGSSGDSYLRKYEKNGNEVWAKKYTGMDVILSIAGDSSGNVYIGGSSSAINGVIKKVDKNGTVLWSYTVPSPSSLSAVYSIDLDASGNVYISTRHGYVIKLNQTSANTTTSPVALWTYTVASATFRKIKVAGSFVYVYREGGYNLIKLDQTSANTTTPPTVSWTSPQTISNFAISGSTLFIGSFNTIVAYGSNNAEVLSIISVIGSPANMTVDSDGYLYFTSTNVLYKYESKTLKRVYDITIGTVNLSALLVSNNYLFVATVAKMMYKIDSDLKPKGYSIRNDIPLNRASDINVYSTLRGITPVAMLDNRILGKINGKYCILANGWDSEPTFITLPVGAVRWALFTRDYINSVNITYRLLVCVGDTLYHNYANGTGGINDWAQSNVWGLPGTLHPTDTTTKTYQGRVRPKFYAPSGATGVFDYMGGMQYRTDKTVDDYTYTDYLYFATYTQTPTPMTLFETFTGIDIYVQYQYGVYDSPNRLGADINVSGLSGTIPADLKLQKRTSNIPNELDREPTNVFTFGSEISVTSIVLDGSKAKVNAPAHGLVTGNVIRFKSTATTPNSNNWISPTTYADLINNAATTVWSGETTPPGGNGKFYQVSKIDDNNFYLLEAVGNPHNHLQCIHIHSLDVVQDGLVLSTGESGITSNFTYLHKKSTLPAAKRMRFGEFSQVHLTSNPKTDMTGSIQRSLGFYMEDDWFIFASDEETYDNNSALPTGRTDFVRHGSTGVYKGTLGQLDDWSSLRCVLSADAVAFFFKKIGDVYLFGDVKGHTYYSLDKGETWQYLYDFKKAITKLSGWNSDKSEFVIDGYLFRLI